MTNYLARVAAAGARTGAAARPPVAAPSILPETVASSRTFGVPPTAVDGAALADWTIATVDDSPPALSTPPSPVRSRPDGAESTPSAVREAGPSVDDTTRADSSRPGRPGPDPSAPLGHLWGAATFSRDARDPSSPTPSPGGAFSARGKGLERDIPLETPLPRLEEGVGGEGDPGTSKRGQSPGDRPYPVTATRQESRLLSFSTAADPVAPPAALAAILRQAVPTSGPEPARPVDRRPEQGADRPLPERAASPTLGRQPTTGTPLPPSQVPSSPAVARSTSRIRVVVGRLDVQVHVASVAPTARPARQPGPSARDSLAARYLDRFGLG